MADFLLSFDPQVEGKRVLRLLQQPYGARAPGGQEMHYPWGTLAVLEDPIAKGRNLVQNAGAAIAWVGDLVLPHGERGMNDALEKLRLPASVDGSGSGFMAAVKGCGLLESLNGAFALVVATDRQVAVVTDPLASVQVYEARDGAGRLVALGTHPDVVARCLGEFDEIDPISVSDFINSGIACCPHTMHRMVTELAPGTVRTVELATGRAPVEGTFPYWIPPDEISGACNERELVEEFVRRWQLAVQVRCNGEHMGVQLSGGLDSRIVMAAIPAELKCTGLTLCDTMNREAQIARRVAACYDRPWEPLQRDPEYLGRTLLAATRLTGCEGEWHHGHTIGFAEQIAGMGVDAVFTGLLMDNNFKGYYAQDVKRVARWGGLLGADYQIAPVDYVNQISATCRQQVRPEFIAGTLGRRQAFFDSHFARRRWSAAEWLDGYPYSQMCDNTGWVIERRVMPMRLPVMDRGLMELAFQVPMRVKAGGGFFEKAAVQIMGPGRRIPNANNGVRPGSGHVSKLIQRTVRKTENSRRRLLTRLGVSLEVPHSWHDFQKYWAESAVFEELRMAHGENLRGLDVFQTDPVQVLRSKSTPWQLGCRLLQLAAWRSLLKDYRL